MYNGKKKTRKDHLQLHIKSKHEGLTFPCQQCDYLATFPSALKHHVKVKHYNGQSIKNI